MKQSKRRKKSTEYGGTQFRSTYEAQVAEELDKAGLRWEYEPEEIEYTLPPKLYVPDFKVYSEDGTSKYIEVKGYFDNASRFKMWLIKQQYPDLPLAIHLMRNNRLTPKSKSWYTDWLEKNGFPTTVGIKEFRKSLKGGLNDTDD